MRRAGLVAVFLALLAMFIAVQVQAKPGGVKPPPKCPPLCPSPLPSDTPSSTVEPCVPMGNDRSVAEMQVPHSTTVFANCLTIEIADTSGWTPEAVYAEIAMQAQDLDRIAPQLTVHVDPAAGNSTVAAWHTPDGCTDHCTAWAVMVLRADYGGFQFTSDPTKRFYREKVVGHEYGHVWSRFYQWETHGGSWESYATFRGLPFPDPTSQTSEIIAEDYRMCWGTEKGSYSFYGYPHTRDVPGLCDWLMTTWRV